MSEKFDEIISLGREWEEGLGKLISEVKSEIRDSDDEDFKKILGCLEGTGQLLSYFKLAVRDDLYLARMLKGPPVIVAGEITPPGYGQPAPVSVEDIESRLSQTQKELEEMKSRLEEIENEIDKSKKKSDYLSKGIGYGKDLFILIEKVKELIG